MEISKKQLNAQVLNMVEKESWEGHRGHHRDHHRGHLCDDTVWKHITGNVVRENCTRARLRRRNRISYLSSCCEQTTVQNYLKKKERAHSGSQLEVTGHRGGESMAAGTQTSWSLRVQSGSRERMLAISSSSTFFFKIFFCVHILATATPGG